MLLAFSGLNYIAVVVAAIVAFVVGFVWYSKPLFGNMWMKEAGIDEMKMKNSMAMAAISGLIAALISAFILAVLIKSLQAATFTDGILIALAVWIGFYVTIEIVRMSFENSSMKLFFINVFHHLFALVLMSVVLILMH